MRRILAAIALFSLIAGVVLADRYTASKGSWVRIEGTSSLHDWTVESTSINGDLTTAPFSQWVNGQARRIDSAATVSIPVISIKSEHKKMDKLMAEALKSSTNPTIRYELSKAVLANPGSKFVLNTGGKLTIAGVTRDVDMQVTGVRDTTGAWVFTGQLPIRMSDYGIKPPTAMMGTIKTGNDVRITFRWAIEAAK